MLHPIGDAPQLPAVISRHSRIATRLAPPTFLQQQPSLLSLRRDFLLI